MMFNTQKQFGYGYLPGSNLLHTLTMPCNMTLTQSYETQRDLLIGMAYHRGSTLVTQRTYSYDTLGRPLSRSTARNGRTVNDSFVHNSRSELTGATVNGSTYGYAYDNIGNRNTATEGEEVTAYTANNLNQYTAIQENEEAAFVPSFDADGNQTLVKTSTGIWSVEYNAENRPVRFTSADGATIIECSYDTHGRRATKKVTTNGSITLHQRYIYRGYLQLACCDLTRSGHPCLWLLTWAPTQPVATRPLAIRKDGTWYAYGWDLTKNICEVFGQHGYLRTAYSYSPYGEVTADGDVTQPIQWSSEYNDTETALVYYNYRHYNPLGGRWIGRDMLGEKASINSFLYVENFPHGRLDKLGLSSSPVIGQQQPSFQQPPVDGSQECQCCQKYIQSEKVRHASLIKKIKDKGCSLHVSCAKNYRNIADHQAVNNASYITFDCKSLSTAKRVNAMRHELQHAFDSCSGNMGSGCFDSICSEIKAYRNAEYPSRKKNDKLKEELRTRVKPSAKAYCSNNKDSTNFEKEYDKKFDELYDKCID